MPNALSSDEWTMQDLFDLADLIGGKIEAGELPPQNQYGQYII